MAPILPQRGMFAADAGPNGALRREQADVEERGRLSSRER